MDRDRAYRLLADVINLTDRRAHAEATVEHAEERLGRVRADAERRVAAAEESVAKMRSKVDGVSSDLAAAQAAAADVPPELGQELVAVLAGQRGAKQAVLDALRSTTTTDEDVAALAESAGIALVDANSAGAAGEGNRA